MSESTFRNRVETFWDWYTTNAKRIFDAIENATFDDVLPDVSGHVNELWKPLAWVFGPGSEDKGGHSFTISGEGNRARQFLADYWLSKAPELEGWTFYSSRQPGELSEGMGIRIGEDNFDLCGLWVTPEVDDENELVHITAWHPLFSQVDENKKHTVLFLILDEVLGEYGTEQWLGRIDTSDSQLKSALPAAELRDFLLDLEIKKGWEKHAPTETFTVYQLKSPDVNFLRSDTIVGSTCHMDLIGQYLEAEGPIDGTEIEGSGAEFVFLTYPSEIAPEGNESEFRGEIEEYLAAALGEEGLGKHLGGALGLKHSYIDFLLFDGDRSLDKLASALRDRKLPNGTGIHFFEAGNESRRIIL